MIAQLHSVKDVILGDSFCAPSLLVKAETPSRAVLRLPQPMVFAGLYPVEICDYESLKNALAKLTLSDPSVLLENDVSAALGLGWRIGFLGLLHMEVFHQRLEQEYGESVIVTAPSVPYKVGSGLRCCLRVF